MNQHGDHEREEQTPLCICSAGTPHGEEEVVGPRPFVCSQAARQWLWGYERWKAWQRETTCVDAIDSRIDRNGFRPKARALLPCKRKYYHVELARLYSGRGDVLFHVVISPAPASPAAPATSAARPGQRPAACTDPDLAREARGCCCCCCCCWRRWHKNPSVGGALSHPPRCVQRGRGRSRGPATCGGGGGGGGGGDASSCGDCGRWEFCVGDADDAPDQKRA